MVVIVKTYLFYRFDVKSYVARISIADIKKSYYNSYRRENIQLKDSIADMNKHVLTEYYAFSKGNTKPDPIFEFQYSNDKIYHALTKSNDLWFDQIKNLVSDPTRIRFKKVSNLVC